MGCVEIALLWEKEPWVLAISTDHKLAVRPLASPYPSRALGGFILVRESLGLILSKRAFKDWHFELCLTGWQDSIT